MVPMVVLVLATTAACGLAGSASASPVPTPTVAGGSTAGSAADPGPGPAGGSAYSGKSVTAVLAGLPVKGRAPKTGYARSQFGSGWADQDGDGCSTREEILQRDLTKRTTRKSGRCAVVVTGVLADPYTGRSIAFRRGNETSTAVQIDHVVPLLDAWQKGAQKFTPAKRLQLANDPLNLLAVDGPTNESKGAGDAATWLPPSAGYRCAYVARQVEVKATYGLWVTAAEKAAIGRVLATCPARTTP